MLSKQNRAHRLFIAWVLVGLCVPLAGPLLVSADEPQPSDAIVVIGGDHKPERIRRAVELFQQGYAPIVIISAGTRVQEGGDDLPEAEVMRRQAIALGLPETALRIEAQSQSTFQNAYYTAAISQAHQFTSILLVTSTYHSRRAGRIFKEVFGPRVSILVQPSPLNECTVCWWFQADQVGVVFYEYYSWLRYWLGIRLATEAPPKPRAQPTASRATHGKSQARWRSQTADAGR